MTKHMMLDETNYIVGLDMGTHEVVVSYLDHKTLSPSVLDLSGGYGQASIPLSLLYLLEEDEWLIGDSAYLNKDQEGTVFFENLFEADTNDRCFKIGNAQYHTKELLLIFIKKLIEGFNQINPKAKILKLTVSQADDIYDENKELLELSLMPLVSQGIKVNIIPYTQALIIFLQYCGFEIDDKTTVLYYEHNQLRVCHINKLSDQIEVEIGKTEERLSIKAIEKVIKNKIVRLYLESMKKDSLSLEEEIGISRLLTNQLPWFFQRYGLKQDMKLYFNFAYPPFQKVMSFKQMEKLVITFEEILEDFIVKNELKGNKTILIGEGFKMQWPLSIVKKHLTIIDINPFHTIAKGSCIVASQGIIGLNQSSIKYKPLRHKNLGIIIHSQQNEGTFMPIKEGMNLIIIDLEGLKDCILPIYYREPFSNVLTIEDEIIIKNHTNADFIRVNLNMIYREGTVSFTVEYLPL